MLGVWRSSAKTYVLGAEVACVTRSLAARGDAAVLLRARKGSSALRAFVCSMVGIFSDQVGVDPGKGSSWWNLYGEAVVGLDFSQQLPGLAIT